MGVCASHFKSSEREKGSAYAGQTRLLKQVQSFGKLGKGTSLKRCLKQFVTDLQ